MEQLENNEQLDEPIGISYEDIVNSLNGFDEAGLSNGVLNTSIYQYDSQKDCVESISNATIVKPNIQAKLSEYYSCLMVEVVCNDYDELTDLETICSDWLHFVEKKKEEDKFFSLQLVPMRFAGAISIICQSVDIFMNHKESKVLFICDREGIRIQNADPHKLQEELGVHNLKELLDNIDQLE